VPPKPQAARAPSKPAVPVPAKPAARPAAPARPAPAAAPILTAPPPGAGRPWKLWAVLGIVAVACAAGGLLLLKKPEKKEKAVVVEKPAGPDPAVEAKIAELFKQIDAMEGKGQFGEALALLQQVAGLRPDEPRLGTLKPRLEEKLKRLEAFRSAMKRAEAAKEEASAKDTPANWQKVIDACAEAEPQAPLEELKLRAVELSAEASQRRDWAAAREEERKGNLEAAIGLAAKAIAAREAPAELAAYKASLERKKRKIDFDKGAAAARAEADPRKALDLWQAARALADDAADLKEADAKIDALKPRVDPAEREKRYEAAMKAADEALAAGKLDDAQKAYRQARDLKGVDLKADQGLAKIAEARKKAGYDAAMAEAGGFEKKKAWREAEESYGRALRLRPGDRPASERLKEIETVHRPRRITLQLDPTVDIRMEFILVPPGTFTMGDAQGDTDEKPREVTLTKDFWMQSTEVTQAQWRAVMGPKAWSFSGLATLPAEGVSWEEAQKFVAKLGQACPDQIKGRVPALPTEAEWEYACRAGSRTRYSFGDSDADLEEHAWFTRNSQKSTQAAGKKKPNAWGFFDMHGNVAEWCQDYYGPPKGGTDPAGPAEEAPFRVYRGGSWEDRAVNCRSSKREKGPPGKESYSLGLRAVLR
jgi:formylglycine-generating enzyme required for sulfatase activity